MFKGWKFYWHEIMEKQKGASSKQKNNYELHTYTIHITKVLLIRTNILNICLIYWKWQLKITVYENTSRMPQKKLLCLFCNSIITSSIPSVKYSNEERLVSKLKIGLQVLKVFSIVYLISCKQCLGSRSAFFCPVRKKKADPDPGQKGK